MNVVLHQLRKDVHHIRWGLSLWITMLAGATLVVSARLDEHALVSLGRLQAACFLLLCAVVVLSWVLAVRVVHADPADGTTAFWLTRPIAPTHLVVSKLTLILAAFVLLPAGANAMAAAANGIRGTALLGLWADSALLSLFFVSAFTLLATLTRDVGRIVFAALLGGGAWLAVRIVSAIRAVHSPSATDLVRESGLFAGAVLFVIGCLAIIAAQYVTRRARRSLLLAVTLAVGCGALAVFWPWNLAAAGRGFARSEFDASAIRLSFFDASLTRIVADAPRVRISAATQIAGSPPGWMVVPLGLRTSLRFRDGTVVAGGGDVPAPSPLLDSNTHAYQRGLSPYSLESVERAAGGRFVNSLWNPRGDLPPDRRPWAQPLLLAEAPAREVTRNLPTTVGLDATVTCAALRTRISAPVPLRAGSEAQTEGFALRILDAAHERRSIAGDSIEVRARVVRPLSLFPRPLPAVVIALRHASRPDLLLGYVQLRNFVGPTIAATLVPQIDYERISFSHVATPSLTLDAGWLAGARLLVATIEERCTFTKTVRIENLVLKETP